MVEISGYRELNLIGRGASAEVYRAVQASTGQHVAIKVLTSLAETQDVKRRNERFARELRLCSQLHNAHIVRLMDQGVCDDDAPYAVFEYIPGHSLANHLAQYGPLSPLQAKELMLQALDALACAHASGIIHRDLKPQNLMVAQTGPRLTLKVLDFGIGAWVNPVLANDAERLTLAHESLGTPAYCAPEQLRGEDLGPEADLYAWGLIFLECLTGSAVMHGTTMAEVIHQQLAGSAIALPPFIAQHPLGRLLAQVLSKEPKRRIADAAELYATLAEIRVEDILPPRQQPQISSDFDQETLIITTAKNMQRTEMRPMTLVCCKLKLVPTGQGVRPDAELLEQRLADKLSAVQELLGRFGGYPGTTPGGGLLMAYFGYPYQSDQDARLAARTALELRRVVNSWAGELAQLGLRCMVQQSIHSGMVPIVQDKPLISDLSQLALSMLFSVANGQIVVSEDSYHLLRRSAVLSAAIQPLQLETGGEMPLFLLLEERVDVSDQQTPSLLGRADELAQLQRLWRDSSAQSQALLVQADAGMGKSALVNCFADQIEALGKPLLYWRCLPEYRHTALYPILKGLEQALGLTQAESVEVKRSLLRHSLTDAGVEDPNCFQVLCYWLSVPVENSEERLNFSPERQKQLLYSALYSLILSHGRGDAPLLLVIEDLHWIDTVSHEFIAQLLAQSDPGRVMLLLTARGQELPDELLQWAPQRLLLQPLPESEGQALAQQLLGDRIDDPALLRRLVERSGGVPLFINELANLADITQLDGELPLSLMDILCGRINALEAGREVLNWAAVAGYGLEAELLGKLMDRPTSDVQTQLEGLCEMGLLIPEQAAHVVERYAFSHALYRDAAYQQLTSQQLREMHNRLADLLLSRLGESDELPASFIARHYLAGENHSRAAEFTLRAVREDLGMALSKQASERLEDLLTWVDKLPTAEQQNVQLQVYELRVQALTHQFGWAHPSVLESVQKTQAFMRQHALLSTHHVKVATLWALGLFYHVASQRPAVHEIASQLIEMGDHLLDDGLEIMGHCLHGQGHWIDGHYRQAVVDLLKVRELYDPQRHQVLAQQFSLDAHAWSTASLSILFWSQGKTEEAHQFAQQAVARSREIRHMPSLGLALMYQAYIHQYEQNHAAAGQVAGELLGLAETYGLSAVQGYAAAVLGWATDNLEMITGTIGILKSLGCLLGLTYLHSMAADVLLHRGDLTGAQDLLNEGLQLAQESGEYYHLVPLYQQKAYALLRLGDSREAAIKCLQRAQTLSQTQAMRADFYQPLITTYGDDKALNCYW